jgi:hypothetical protein
LNRNPGGLQQQKFTKKLNTTLRKETPKGAVRKQKEIMNVINGKKKT